MTSYVSFLPSLDRFTTSFPMLMSQRICSTPLLTFNPFLKSRGKEEDDFAVHLIADMFAKEIHMPNLIQPCSLTSTVFRGMNMSVRP